MEECNWIFDVQISEWVSNEVIVAFKERMKSNKPKKKKKGGKKKKKK